jgi:hypothetical protein
MGLLYLYNMAIYLSVVDVKARTTEEVLWWSGALMRHSNVQYRLRSQPLTLQKHKTYSGFNGRICRGEALCDDADGYEERAVSIFRF